MRYNYIFIINALIITILLVIKFIKSSIHIIIIGDFNDKDIFIKLNIKYLFNLINIKVPIYPIKIEKNAKSKSKKILSIVKKKKKEESKYRSKGKNINIKAIEKKDIKIIYKLILNIKIEEVYSDINFGNENIHFTAFMYVFINAIYGNIISFSNTEKLYLNINPNFTKNYIRSKIRFYIKPTIKEIIMISLTIVKIYRKIKKSKRDGVIGEINRVNTKSYGENI